MDKRRAERTRKRLACAVITDQRRDAGLVIDLSASGFFIQTAAILDPGAALTLEFETPESPETLRIEGQVARRKVVPARLRSVTRGGIGVVITQAPERYYSFVAGLQAEKPADPEPAKTPRPTKAGPKRPKLSSLEALRRRLPKQPLVRKKPPASKPAPRRFRVRLTEVQGPRCRMLNVRAGDEGEARKQALAEVGKGWKVLDCEARQRS